MFLMRSVFFTLFLLLGPTQLMASTDDLSYEHAINEKKVLVIHSYHPTLIWSQNIDRGIQKVLANSVPARNIGVEYLDTKRYVSESYLSQMRQMIATKYKDTIPDIFITVDDAAFLEMIKLRKEFPTFERVPIVFVGLNGYDSYQEVLRDEVNFTGVTEEHDLLESLRFIKKIQPTVKKVIFISSEFSKSGRYGIENLRKIESQLRGLEIEMASHYSFRGLAERFSKAKSTTVGFIFEYSRDRNGIFQGFRKMAKYVSTRSRVPIYSGVDVYLGHGVVGGLLISGEKHGEVAAKMAIDVLKGKSTDNMSIIRKGPSTKIFDYKVLKKFGLTRFNPDGETILINNRQDLANFFKSYSPVFWVAGMLAIILTTLVVFLLFSNRKKAEYAKSVDELNQNLEFRVRLRTEQLLEQQSKAFSNAKLASIGEMAASIAHEINNPLSVIHMLASRIKRHEADERTLQTAEKIRVTVDRIAEIVRSLKLLSKDGQGGVKTEIEIQAVVNDTLNLSSTRLRNHGIDLILNLEEEGLLVNGNFVQLGQVVLNLLNNAFDATEGVKNPWIKLELVRDENKAIISCTDSGTGIHQDLVQKIMRPFYSTKDPSKGTGLGLSISQNIIKDHDGTLYYDSNSPNTRFVIELPIVKSE